MAVERPLVTGTAADPNSRNQFKKRKRLDSRTDSRTGSHTGSHTDSNSRSNGHGRINDHVRKHSRTHESTDSTGGFVKVENPVIREAKKIWNQARQKELKQEERSRLVAKLMSTVSGRVRELSMKHDASRIVQTLIKYGSHDARSQILTELSDSIVELAKSPYGKFLVAKLLHYGTAQDRQRILDAMHGHVARLIGHREAAHVVEDAFREYANATQRLALAQELLGPEFALLEQTETLSLGELIARHPERQQLMLKNLLDTIARAVRKGSIGFTIVHHSLLQCLEHGNASQRGECVELIKDQIAEIVHTKDGSDAAIRAFALASAKERKSFLRSLKPFLRRALEDEHGYLVVIAAMETVDDTVLLGKILRSETKQDLRHLLCHKFARRPFLYLFTGNEDNSRYFTKDVIERLRPLQNLKGETSKKDDKVRRAELLAACAPAVVDLIASDCAAVMADPRGAQMALEALLCTTGDFTKYAALDAIAKELARDPAESNHLIHQLHTSRIVKSLVQNGHWNRNTESVQEISEDLRFSERLLPPILKHIKSWACGPGCFIIGALLSSIKAEGERNKLVKALRTHKDELSAALNAGQKGISILIDAVK